MYNPEKKHIFSFFEDSDLDQIEMYQQSNSMNAFSPKRLISSSNSNNTNNNDPTTTTTNTGPTTFSTTSQSIQANNQTEFLQPLLVNTTK